MADETDFVTMVANVGDAVQAAQDELQEHSLRIDSVELEVACTAKRGVDGTIKLGPITLGAGVARSQVQTVTVTLAAPEPRKLIGAKAPSVDDALAGAIVVAAATTRAAALKLPTLRMKGTTVALQVVAQKDGTLKIALGGEASQETTHAVRITLA